MKDLYISIDVEGTGVPGLGSMLSLGAVVIGEPRHNFYAEFKPIPNMPWDPAAARVHGLQRDDLARNGHDPRAGMAWFTNWVESLAAEAARRPVAVHFGTYDWMWVGAYLATYGDGYTAPFGPNSLDMKSYFMGWRDTDWKGTAKSRMPARLKSQRAHTHNALDDAIEQGEMFAKWLAERASPRVRTYQGVPSDASP